ncbi:hypothetical protein [Amycolatopsis sp. cmx-11-51]|uniref:hypothetical protein n=1 Tax=unclassified Amycolatopsis TaxID=2618356 RepID=UPI0039E31A7D
MPATSADASSCPASPMPSVAASPGHGSPSTAAANPVPGSASSAVMISRYRSRRALRTGRPDSSVVATPRWYARPARPQSGRAEVWTFLAPD